MPSLPDNQREQGCRPVQTKTGRSRSPECRGSPQTAEVRGIDAALKRRMWQESSSCMRKQALQAGQLVRQPAPRQHDPAFSACCAALSWCCSTHSACHQSTCRAGPDPHQGADVAGKLDGIVGRAAEASVVVVLAVDAGGHGVQAQGGGRQRAERGHGGDRRAGLPHAQAHSRVIQAGVEGLRVAGGNHDGGRTEVLRAGRGREGASRSRRVGR